MKTKTYTVQQGESPTIIARRFGFGLGDLLAANPQKPQTTVNGVRTWTSLGVGEQIEVPDDGCLGAMPGVATSSVGVAPVVQPVTQPAVWPSPPGKWVFVANGLTAPQWLKMAMAQTRTSCSYSDLQSPPYQQAKCAVVDGVTYVRVPGPVGEQLASVTYMKWVPVQLKGWRFPGPQPSPPRRPTVAQTPASSILQNSVSNVLPSELVALADGGHAGATGDGEDDR